MTSGVVGGGASLGSVLGASVFSDGIPHSYITSGDKMMGGDENLVTVLEEMRVANEGAWAAGDALDQKANFLFAGGSVVSGILAALVLAGPRAATLMAWRWALLAVTASMYLAMTLVFIMVISPRRYRTALAEEREVIEREILDRDRQTVLLSLIEGYLETIAHNRGVNKKKARGVKWCAILLLVLVMLLMISSLLVA